MCKLWLGLANLKPHGEIRSNYGVCLGRLNEAIAWLTLFLALTGATKLSRKREKRKRYLSLPFRSHNKSAADTMLPGQIQGSN
jgi:hypothetical protein